METAPHHDAGTTYTSASDIARRVIGLAPGVYLRKGESSRAPNGLVLHKALGISQEELQAKWEEASRFLGKNKRIKCSSVGKTNKTYLVQVLGQGTNTGETVGLLAQEIRDVSKKLRSRLAEKERSTGRKGFQAFIDKDGHYIFDTVEEYEGLTIKGPMAMKLFKALSGSSLDEATPQLRAQFGQAFEHLVQVVEGGMQSYPHCQRLTAQAVALGCASTSRSTLDLRSKQGLGPHSATLRTMEKVVAQRKSGAANQTAQLHNLPAEVLEPGTGSPLLIKPGTIIYGPPPPAIPPLPAPGIRASTAKNHARKTNAAPSRRKLGAPPKSFVTSFQNP